MNRVLARFAAGALLLSACSSGGGEAKESTATTKRVAQTTTTTPTTSTVVSDPNVAALTGLPADARVRNRPALVVKIDNFAAKAYPQHGIGAADIVICEGVEGGITRLAAIFHSMDASVVGPVRSARSSDLHFAVPLGRALFAYSGTNGTFQKLIAASPVIDLSPGKLPSAYTRNSKRVAPYNLFSGTPKFYGGAPSGATPAKPLFRMGDATTQVEGTPVAKLDVFWKMPDRPTRTDASWTWSGGKPARVQAGQATVDANGPAVSPRNIVVLFVEYVDTGERDQSKSIVPEAKLEGAGAAWVIRDGKLVKGTWAKTGTAAPVVLRDDEGRSIDLLPGQTWVEMPAPGNASVA